MGYGFYMIGDRPSGYYVIATCDKRGCDAEIDRGLGFLCGSDPHRPGIDVEPGCGRYFCGAHLGWVATRGGCSHRQRRSWGRTLSDLVASEDGSIVCCDRTGHAGKHAWERGAAAL